jgi:lipopolysaccharide/colanic/teichoic acid biosynthesis glycosyltransferase
MYPFLKRLADILLSGMALLAFAPFLIPLMIVLRLTGEGEVFFRQLRVGYRNMPFILIKFATMLKDSPNLTTGTITTKNDPRILPLGHFLRKTKINELAQLFNVFLGDMSVIGPRPQTMECFLMFPADRRDRIYLSKPGLSSLGSVVFRNEEDIIGQSAKSYDACYREEIMPYKADLELWYLENKSIRVDAAIIFLTVVELFFPDTALYRKVFRNLPEKAEVGRQEINRERAQRAQKKNYLATKRHKRHKKERECFLTTNNTNLHE